MALTDKLSAIGDAIREKTGKEELLTLDQMPTEIASIETGGGSADHSAEDGLITRTVTEYFNDRVTNIGAHAFYYNTIIEKVSFPNVTEVGGNVFNGCTALKNIEFPKLEKATAGNVFKACSALEEARFPAYGYEGMPSFNGCTKLSLVEVGNLGSISNGTFNACSALKTLIIRKTDKVALLVNVGAFSNTPFASDGSGGSVYVPQALVESYKTATNWSTLYTAGTCNFVAIEGSIYE